MSECNFLTNKVLNAILSNFQTKRHLEQMVDELNAGRPQCPVGLNTLVIPRKATLTSTEKQPVVYLNCGHVQGLHEWGHEKDSNSHTCPMCLKVILPTVYLCAWVLLLFVPGFSCSERWAVCVHQAVIFFSPL